MKKVAVVFLCIFALVTAGCQDELLILHPADPNDLIIVPKGTRVGEIIIDRDGCFYSNEFQKEVMQVKVEK